MSRTYEIIVKEFVEDHEVGGARSIWLDLVPVKDQESQVDDIESLIKTTLKDRNSNFTAGPVLEIIPPSQYSEVEIERGHN